MPVLTENSFRALARSSPWRWRALSFDLHRRPLHGPEHAVRATVVRPDRVVVIGADGRLHDTTYPRQTVTRMYLGAGSRPSATVELPYASEVEVDLDADGLVAVRPHEPMGGDPMWRDYEFVAMLDPVELADASPPEDGSWAVGTPRPQAVLLHRLDTGRRHGRDTWWAEVSARYGYEPRCSCCPLLFGRASTDLEAVERGATPGPPPESGVYLDRHLVGLDVATGVCVHVEHLDGDFVGRGFSVDIRGVDDEVVLPGV
ncbi:hypothetical protein [Oryzobacter telluris]|uniref:hypothetical protein n=1 Tax=Oryzobacter telluris TaxID=3149179 RepID=UPI00370D5FC9